MKVADEPPATLPTPHPPASAASFEFHAPAESPQPPPVAAAPPHPLALGAAAAPEAQPPPPPPPQPPPAVFAPQSFADVSRSHGPGDIPPQPLAVLPPHPGLIGLSTAGGISSML